MPSELSKAKRRIRQLEKCLAWVRRWCFGQLVDLNGRGADNDDNVNYREVRRLQNRLNRTP